MLVQAPPWEIPARQTLIGQVAVKGIIVCQKVKIVAAGGWRGKDGHPQLEAQRGLLQEAQPLLAE